MKILQEYGIHLVIIIWFSTKALAVKNALETIGANFNGDLEELQLQTQDTLNQQRRRDQVQSVRQPTGNEEVTEK